MKKFLLFCAALCTGLMSFAQLEGVIVEEYVLNEGGVQPAGTTTYRIYADMVQSNDLVSAVFAIQDCHPLDISTTTTFHNDVAFGSTTAAGINPGLFGFFPDLEADSWVTIGGDDQFVPGMGTDLFVAFTIPADPVTPATGVPGGGNLVADDGAWFSLATSPLVVPSGPDNVVLIGQFTTDGDLSFNINLQCFLDGDQANRVDYVYDAACENGGTLTGFEQQESFLTFPEPAGNPGCTDPTACNFDPAATDDDGSCEFVSCAGCTDPTACNFDATATIDDGSCEFVSCAGCTDNTACNFDPAATIDDNATCVFPGDPCDDGDPGTANDEVQLDCSCAGTLIIFGCTDPTACNFDATANNDDGSCEFVSCAGCTDPTACNFDGTATIDDGSCEFVSCAGCTNPTACNFDATATIDDGSCILVGDACDDGDAGTENDQIQADCSCAGTAIVDGCTDPTACNFNPGATNDDGSCTFPGDACDDGDATTVGDEIQADCSCAGVQVPGCTDIAACNYDPAATVDDGSCFFVGDSCDDGDAGTMMDTVQADCSCAGVVIVEGCTDPAACEYDPAANVDNGSCATFPGDACDDGDAGTIDDTVQADCSCVGTVAVPGCTDPNSCEYDPAANVDDGSCATFFGCTDPIAENYDPAAGCDDGSCVFSDLNDVPALAAALPVTMLGTCNSVAGDVDAAQVVAPEATATATAGLWYSFVAPTPAARVEVASGDFDVVVELQDMGGSVLDVEDVVAGNGNEIMNYNGLTAGMTYLVRVAPLAATAGPANFDICVQMIPDTRCDYGPGPYTLCDIFKADWVAADDYVFNFTSQTDGDVFSYQQGFSNTLIFLATAGIEYGDSYDVALNSVFNLADGAGNIEEIIVDNDEPCTIDVLEQPLAALRESDNQENFGAHFIGGYVGATPFICGALDWEWEFTNTDGTQLPITWLRGSTDRFFQLSAVGSLVPGAVYEARVRPIFASGPGLYGGTELLAIVGPAEVMEVEAPIVLADDAERLDIVDMTSTSIYPNPSNGEIININVADIPADVEKISIDIFDMYGKMVHSEQVASTGSNLLVTMSMNDLATGVYLVNITVGNEVRTERLSIQK